MKTNELLDSKTFLQWLTNGNGSLVTQTMTVQGQVTIDRSTFDTLNLQGITFTGMLMIQNFNLNTTLLILQSSNFLGGLMIENCAGGHILISESSAKHITIWSCVFDSLHLCNLKVEGSIDISGAKLSKRLEINNVQSSELELVHSTTSNTISTPMVRTDDPLIAKQFRMAGIPVFMSTEAVRGMMTRPESSAHPHREYA